MLALYRDSIADQTLPLAVTDTDRDAETEAEREEDREEEPSSLQKHTLDDVKEVVVERKSENEGVGYMEGSAEMKEGAEADEMLQLKTEVKREQEGEGGAMTEGVCEAKDSEAGSAGQRDTLSCLVAVTLDIAAAALLRTQAAVCNAL